MFNDNDNECMLFMKVCHVSDDETEKVSRGGRAPRPSMMWSIVQETSSGRALVLPLLLLLLLATEARGADLVIEVPGAGGAGGAGGGHYRLDYRPPHGVPAPNFTVPARASTINFQGQPGTQYHFMLYYSNDSLADLLTWNQTIVTAPEPPTDLAVLAGKNKQALVTWRPPARGAHSGFRFRVAALTPGAGGGGDFAAGADERSHALRDLFPGATYQLHAFTTLLDKESAAYASTNFTTKPNTPGKFIVWFRNETTLLVLWQPPYPPGAYTHYKVSILPADARDAELYVEKEGEPPGPAQAAFKGLVPGRAYNISVQTVSEPEISAPTTAQYRTVPLRPRDVRAAAGAGWLEVSWRAPAERCEFDRYQVALAGSRRVGPATVAREAPPRYKFDNLTPGAQHSVSVKTMSGKVTSWPAQIDVTIKPLPVLDPTVSGGDDEPLALAWNPAPGSLQDAYRVSYRELDAAPAAPHEGELVVQRPKAALDALLPGRNYSLDVRALSHDAAADPVRAHARTRPRAPLALRADPAPRTLRLTWDPDPASRQDAWRVRWRRAGAARDAGELHATAAAAEAGELFPGAAYEVRVAALAGGLAGPERALLAAVPPLPPQNVSVARASSDAAVVRWSGPDRAQSAVGAFVLRYRTRGDSAWTLLPPLGADQTEAEVVDMTRGERYTIQLDAASEPAERGPVESGRPLRAEHAVDPPPVTDVAALLDATNLTLEWPRPEGRVETYEIRWWPQEEGEDPGERRRTDLPAGDRPVLRARLDRLDPGARYVLAVSAHSAGLVSEELRLAARTRPLCQSELTVAADDPPDGDARAFRVLYTPTPAAAARFDRYRVTLRAADGDGRDERSEERAADAERRVRFDGLDPGRLYNVSLATLSHNVSSQPVTRQRRPAPGAVRGLRADVVEAERVLLRWEAPPGVFTDFEVQYAEAADRLRTLHTARLELEAVGLRPHTEYTFSVEARAGGGRSAAASVRARTRESPPGALELAAGEALPGRVALTWALPAERRGGAVRRVSVRYWAEAEGAESARVAVFPAESAGGAVSGLRPGRRYVFAAWAETGAGAGPTRELRVAVPVGAPPPARALPREAGRSPYTLTLRFTSDLFSSDNGEVTAYTVVVSEAGAVAGAGAGAPLPSWQDVQRLAVWPPYQATEPYFPFGSRDEAEITLGTERCERARRLYCNGPLKPSTTYHVALRAFTAPDKFADTARLTLTTEADGTAWAWGGGAAGAALLLAGVGALLWRRRGATTAPPPRPSRPVPLERFAEHCRLMAADSDFRFSEEFEELKRVGRDQPCTAADLPCNRPKNRFTNVLPYDHSRFKLQPVDDEEGSDYINANYVPGHASPREFIVTQGPLHSTRDDFWRMVWESGARAIVMLTRLVEKGRDKCERYWPLDGRPVRYGDVTVSVLSECRFPDWAVSELLAARGADQRRIPHLHFTTWPDFGVPAPASTLARFVRAFRDRVEGARPVVVHCSAGVGRSGTFVALDRALQQLAGGAAALDVFGLVAALRTERPHMVQTEQQYIAIHQCVLAALDGQDLRPPPPLSNDNAAYDDDEGIAESGM